MNFTRLILALALAALLSACATEQNHYDPIEPVNRVTDNVNDKIDRVTLKPLAEGYNYVLPKPMRHAVTNFFDNATYLNTVLNDFLQGKGGQGFSDLGRFLVNTTLGVGGLVDVATSMGLEHHYEDFGQTLAVWGMNEGAYIVYPILGPNSVRKTPDLLTSTATDPLFWASLVVAPYVTVPLTALKYIDKRANLLEASDMRDELAMDRYAFTRDAYRQNREYEIYDGNPPTKVPADDGWGDEEEWGDEAAPAAAPEPASAPRTGIHLEPAPVDTPPVESTPAAPATPVPADKPLEMKQAPEQQHLRLINVINLSSHHNHEEALAAQQALAARGISTEIHVTEIQGSTWYRLRYTGDMTGGAKQQLNRLRQIDGLEGAWMESVKP